MIYIYMYENRVEKFRNIQNIQFKKSMINKYNIIYHKSK